MKEMSNEWHGKVLRLGKREHDTDYEEFVKMIYALESYTLKTTKTLLKTYRVYYI